MSINWVMLKDQDGFVHLPNEQLLFKSPPRIGFSLQPLGSYKGSDSISLQSSGGHIYLTNQRVVYLPSQSTEEFQSFSAPLLSVRDSHVSAPFFGPNVWQALIQPVSGGGIPPSLPAVQVKATFKEGGAFDFQNQLERVKERLQQAMEFSSESTRGVQEINLSGVHLDELPAYDGPQDGGSAGHSHEGPTSTSYNSHAPPYSGPEPAEPPPGYEEVQQQSVANELEERMRRAN
jgi:hypothetical protein